MSWTMRSFSHKEKKAEAERWIDDTFNYFLQTYGAKMCAKAFNRGDETALPRREERRHVTTFMTSYIQAIIFSSLCKQSIKP